MTTLKDGITSLDTHESPVPRHRIEQTHQYFDALDLPLFPWHAGPKHRFVRIEPVEITGRRFHVLGHDAWGGDHPPAAHAPDE